jgi:hypothetical protein
VRLAVADAFVPPGVAILGTGGQSLHRGGAPPPILIYDSSTSETAAANASLVPLCMVTMGEASGLIRSCLPGSPLHGNHGRGQWPDPLSSVRCGTLVVFRWLALPGRGDDTVLQELWAKALPDCCVLGQRRWCYLGVVFLPLGVVAMLSA